MSHPNAIIAVRQNRAAGQVLDALFYLQVIWYLIGRRKIYFQELCHAFGAIDTHLLRAYFFRISK
jgi:hypothetical protein